MSTINNKLDPYTAQAQNDTMTLQEKISGFDVNTPVESFQLYNPWVSIVFRSQRDYQGNENCYANHSLRRWADALARHESSRWCALGWIYTQNPHRFILSADSETQLTLTFIANNVSHKFEEIQNDSHVNVSFLDPSTTNWAS